MTGRILLSALVAIGMHSSLCTGGLFAVTAAIAHDAAYKVGDAGPMSYGAIGYLSCKSTERTNEEVSTSADVGCSDASTCISRVSADMKTKLQVFSAPSLDLVTQPPAQPIVVAVATDTTKLLARDGPLYELGPQLVHSLQKRE